MADDDLQFETVETEQSTPVGAFCVPCGKVIEDEYWIANEHVVCATCRVNGEQVGGFGLRLRRFVLAGLIGTAGGAVGAAIWWGIVKLTGYELGLIAILVGFLVGGGVRLGSGSRGGLLYQLMAVVITYASVAAAYAPLIAEAWRENPEMAEVPGVVLALGAWLIGFAAPFMAGAKNIIGILIIGFALWQAWKMNQHVPIAWGGPFRLRAAEPPPLGSASPQNTPPLLG